MAKDDGVVNPPSDVMDLRSANLDSKNYRCRTSTPRGGRGNGTPIEDDGVVNPPSDVTDLRSANLDSKNYRCRTSTPTARPARKRDSD
jgi:hypothetical protein